MTTGFHTATTGMIWTQRSLDVTANNIANLSTDGYKSDKASFADLLYTQIRDPSQDPNLKVGHGSKLGKTDTVFNTSSLDKTDRPQDYALPDERQFFAVRKADGSTFFTRDGRFIVSKRSDGRFYLANASGDEILGQNGGPIIVTDPKAAQNVGVFTFRNLDGLVKAGSNTYMATNRSGPAAGVANAQVWQGYLESSGADIATEMTNMIMQQRSYELDAKMVVMTDEVMQTVNNLR